MKPTRKHLAAYAFIDSQNLNMGVSDTVVVQGRVIYRGWKLDFDKFRRFLTDKYHVKTAFLFIGNMPGNENLYESLQRAGYVLVLKPTTTFIDDEGKVRVKGNVDTDLVLHAAAKEFANYDRAVIVSGDGDFLSLYDYLLESGKSIKILIPNKFRYSKLISDKYSGHLDFVSANRKKLEKADRQTDKQTDKKT